jgi:hypothetical protein
MDRGKDRKAALIAEIERARRGMDQSSRGMRAAMDFPSRARRHMSRNLPLWIGGAVLAGMLIARFRGSRRVRPVNAAGALGSAGRAGLLLAAGRIAFDFARPFIFRVARQRLEPLLAAWLNRHRPAGDDFDGSIG